MNQQSPVDLTTIPPRAVVLDSEGDLAGTVVDTSPTCLTMTDNRIRPTTYYVPVQEVDSFDGTYVRLKATEEQIRLSAWSLGPPSEPTQSP